MSDLPAATSAELARFFDLPHVPDGAPADESPAPQVALATPEPGARNWKSGPTMTACPHCGRTFDDGVRFCPVDGAKVVQAAEDRNIGQVLLGQFEVRDVCGRGAMGTVYRAYQRTMDRIVAVKILRRELLKESEVVRRFLREARAAARLMHPNIVTVHLVGETDEGVPFIVMEHIDGVSLEAICEAQGAQPLERTINLARQIASALSEAHAAGIVHRDLKPANILITDRSRIPDLVKVLDFGIAKLLHGADQSVMSRDGLIFGTPHYIAPEQATAAEVDHRVDLYSLGVILFRLATGRLPFEGDASMQVVLKHLREAPPRPRAINPAVPAELEALILQLLAKDRAGRPRDAEAVIAALDAIPLRAATATATAPGPEGTLLGVPRAPAPAPAGTRPAATAPRPGSAAASPTARGGDPRRSPTPVAAPARPAVVGAPTPARGSGRAVRPAPAAETGRVRRPNGSRPIVVGAFAAIAVGTAIGIGAALVNNHRGANERMGAAPSLPSAPALPPINAKPPLFDEHVLREGGVTLRAGFEQPPVVGAAAPLVVELAEEQPGGARTMLSGARVDVVATPPGTKPVDERVSATATGEPGRYRAATTFRTAGAYKLRIEAAIAGRAPMTLVFDVDSHAATAAAPRTPAPASPPTTPPSATPTTTTPAPPTGTPAAAPPSTTVAARHDRPPRARRSREEETPVTIIGPDGTSATPTPTPAPTPMPVARPIEPAPTHVAPPPAATPPPAARPTEEPPPPPRAPPSSDPTTLPLPSADETN
jgi:serine/threonine-protein kinase